MSAWRHRIFDDDITLDCLGDLNASEDIVQALESFLSEALEYADDYLDYDAGAYGLAAACVIDAKLNGLELELLSDGCAEEELNSILDKLENIDISGLRQMAADTVKAVAADNSELRELWEENEECYPLVMDTYNKLIQRLEK